MITLISSKKLGGYKIMRNTVELQLRSLEENYHPKKFANRIFLDKIFFGRYLTKKYISECNAMLAYIFICQAESGYCSENYNFFMHKG